MSCSQPICRIIPCPDTGTIPSYSGSYSLQNGTVFVNNEISFSTPNGTYTLPPDSIVIVVPPGATNVSYQGCQNTVTRPVAGLSQAEIASLIAEMMQLIARQQAICDGFYITPVSGLSANSAQTAHCSGGLQMKLVGTLPSGVSFTIDGLTVAPGLFTASSVALANSHALAYAQSLISRTPQIVQCGWYNEDTDFVCPGGNISHVPAGQFFSEISQDDANDLADNYAEAHCLPTSTIDWSQLFWGSYLASYTSQEPVFTPYLDYGADWIIECQINGSPGIPAANDEATVDSFTGLQGAYIQYLGPEVAAKLTVTNSLDHTGSVVVRQQYFRVSIFTGTAFVADILVKDITNDYGTRTYDLVIPDTTVYAEPIYITFQVHNGLEIQNVGNPYPTTILSMSGTFSNT